MFVHPVTAQQLEVVNKPSGDALCNCGQFVARPTSWLVKDLHFGTEIRRVAIESNHAESCGPKCDEIPTTIHIASGLANISDRSNRGDLTSADVDHAERRTRLHAALYHQSVSRFEDVQRQRHAREEDEVQRKEWNQ